MADKSHIGHRQKYVEFRFEQSLRKYEPPPRKLIKMGSSICQNCDRKSCESKRESRLIRLCETRKLYHATSRERASEFSRKREAIQLSQQKASENVSDFNCNENNHSDFPESQKQNEFQKKQQLNNNDWYNPRYKAESQGMIKWQINIVQTPIKQQLRQQLLMKQSQFEQSMQDSIQRQQVNDVKVKDIEFHIGLVEQLHHKIKQYIQLDSQNACRSNLHESSIQQQWQSEKQFIQPMKGEIKMDIECGAKEHNKEQQSKVICFISSLSGEKIAFGSNNLELEEFVINGNAGAIKQQRMIIQSNNEINFCQQKMNYLNQKAKILKQQVGRIQIKGEKGQCLLSARIMNKLLTSKLSLDKVKRTVLRHHPYLEDISELLKMTVQKIQKWNH